MLRVPPAEAEPSTYIPNQCDNQCDNINYHYPDFDRNYARERLMPNSAAGPLPNAFYSHKIPLSAGSTNRIQAIDKKCILYVERALFEGWKNVFLCLQRKSGRLSAGPRRTLPSLAAVRRREGAPCRHRGCRPCARR